ncbi:hypothetical protein N7532_001598 [Penicillium argentinense]|uniref:Uncharacterized protein n=1 Tax=Penicillium argentinense TaxID=1131581 RepID=A0A9W9G312_9EURO|nr:uncharacterized protein N7532_001598 [Penicillium argentinense]KAJ5111063.1 hypothetical protein N7532_001598 [Penicillium argentinense]
MKVAFVLLCAALSTGLPIQLVLTGDTPTIHISSKKASAQQTTKTGEQKFPIPEPFQDYVEHLRLEHEQPSSAKGSDFDAVPAESKSKSQEDQLTSVKHYGSFMGKLRLSKLPEQHDDPISFNHQYGIFAGKGTSKHPTKATASKHDSEPDSSLGQFYGTFLGKMDSLIPSETHPRHALAQSRKNTCGSKRVVSYSKPSDLIDVLDAHGPECVALAIFVLFPLAYFVLEGLELVVKSWVSEKYPHRGRERVRLDGPERQLRAWKNRQREMVLDEKKWWRTRQVRA